MERLLFSGYNPDMRVPALVACLALIGLNACGGGTALPVPTSSPQATSVIAVEPSSTGMPGSPEASLAPSQGVSKTPESLSTSTPEPGPSDTALPATLIPPIVQPTQPPPATLPAATAIPQPAVGSSVLQFLYPGPLSKLVSPFYINGYAIPGFNNTGNVTLYGEDGRVLDSQLIGLYTAYTWAYYAWHLTFQVQGAGEFGRLTMSTKDEFGRLIAVYSIHLILLPEGNSVVTPPGDLKERCAITQPVQGKWLSGGTLQVAGKIRPFNALPLVVQLIDRNGKLIASQLVSAPPASDDSYVPFQASLPYTIANGTWARLSVSQADDRISGMMYLYSTEIYLHP